MCVCVCCQISTNYYQPNLGRPGNCVPLREDACGTVNPPKTRCSKGWVPVLPQPLLITNDPTEATGSCRGPKARGPFSIKGSTTSKKRYSRWFRASASMLSESAPLLGVFVAGVFVGGLLRGDVLAVLVGNKLYNVYGELPLLVADIQ